MYIPDHFRETRPEFLHELIRAHPLAALVTRSSSGVEANHIPFHLDADSGTHGRLLGHVARSNPLWIDLGAGADALAIFQGPSSYVSPSWYPTKYEHGRVVPTWNYAVVHVHGVLIPRDDPEWVREQVEQLTRDMEASRAMPWAVSDAPADYVERMLQGIVGIELVIERVVGKWKLSQNQPAANRAGVVAALDESDDPLGRETARAMREHRPQGG